MIDDLLLLFLSVRYVEYVFQSYEFAAVKEVPDYLLIVIDHSGRVVNTLANRMTTLYGRTMRCKRSR
jgi:hypothetical protein